MIFSSLYTKSRLIVEDSQHSGYLTTLETPRELGELDYKLVGVNSGRKVGQELIDINGNVVKNSKILQNSESMLQYSHAEGTEIHIESVEVYRNLWNSIHIPAESGQFIGK
ncbi:hypothetical protein Ac42p207 [Acinetobacter phage Ac42]|uniref:hypothetical protein n=1 Tax=Acinetobacter phage Ac42 TaxID=762660 RepID=UPI0001EBCDF9|nr:hypothetical protein Ac42p207 [Acinetobacter phage Ac42]ADI96445.1 hypothetical protein Ac42p207 [Acinetobacter phage Ac42]